MKQLLVLEVRSEIGAGTRGASLGIDAIKMAALNAQSDFFSVHPSRAVPTENHRLFTAVDTPHARHIEGMVTVYERVAAAVGQALEDHYFPLILAADHASAGGTIAGLKQQHPNQRLGVIWIDAHADLHSPYTSPSGNMHGMPLAVSLGEDNPEASRNEASEKTRSAWEALKNTAIDGPKLNPEDIAFIGLRDLEAEEQHLIDKHHIPVYPVAEVRAQGVAAIASRVLEQLKDCDVLYISFDVDSMDPEVVSYGTGTPVPQGLFEAEVSGLLEVLLASEKVRCLEVVEVNPLLDRTANGMGETAFRIVEKAAAAIPAGNVTSWV